MTKVEEIKRTLEIEKEMFQMIIKRLHEALLNISSFHYQLSDGTTDNPVHPEWMIIPEGKLEDIQHLADIIQEFEHLPDCDDSWEPIADETFTELIINLIHQYHNGDNSYNPVHPEWMMKALFTIAMARQEYNNLRKWTGL